MATIDERKLYTHDEEWRTPQNRASERAEISSKVAEFLAQGHEITTIPAGLGVDSPANLWGAMGSLRLSRTKSRRQADSPVRAPGARRDTPHP